MSVGIGALAFVFVSVPLMSTCQMGFSAMSESASLTLLGLGFVLVAHSLKKLRSNS
jgi:hypothetical protein